MNFFNNSGGNKGNMKESEGSTILVQMTEQQWEELSDALDKSDGLVGQDVVCRELGICKKTLANLIAAGKITRRMYTVAVNGVKKFFIRRILGLEK